ncbi:RagB/SusD family nutrient uptake outer membrane protein [Flavivirga aquimarina]|uniref:RagB/SusD family nutrient uptake outer membrane protein n=1 Tax=Flavivirga aquimarina TaxID=2027862 RepID=A0ABT8W8Z4_9FLAO|nr:RagB/SusD family nutrient uptake outer membrane protein [Flavivirga aquimarina]MDO5969605.1 RagB/SusD family nutrient uptake outer membrane protein [Flavivirga aquimarina]
MRRIIFLSLVILAIGCDDSDFLDTSPETFLTVDNIFTSGAQVDQVLITMYQQDRALHAQVDNAQGRVMHGQGTDLITVPTFRQNTNFSDYNSTFTPRAGRLNTIYRELYEMISRANLVLSLTEREDIAFESEAVRAYIAAQAKFFRAKAHGEAAQFFGRVAIVDEPTTTVRFDYEQSERAEIYQFAIDDLESILNDLPVTTTEPGRVVRGAAQHYLAEFYLGVGVENNDDSAYDQAIKYASDIIDGGTYSLMQNRFGTRAAEAGKNVWWDLFRLGNQNYADGNTESIWVYQFDYEAFKAGDGARLRYPYYYSPVWRAIPGVIGEDEYTGGRGIAIFRPTDLAENIIWDPSISDGDMRGDESNIRRTVFYNDPTFPDSDPGSLLGQEVPMADLIAANDGLADGAYFPIFEKLTTDQFEGLEDGRRMEDLWRGRYAVRLPSTILLRAEAHFRKGDNQSAADDINLIRERAQCNVLATAGMVDIDFILDERARELYVEENRWATLLRMGGNVASDRIRRFARYDYQVNSLTFDYNTFPIPQAVIDRNKDVVWQQNPGWEGR